MLTVGVVHDQAMDMYKRMLAVGINPNLSTYNAMSPVFARGGIWKQFELILEEMKDGLGGSHNCKKCTA